ncbi:DC1 - like 10 [Theobroma cacao]|nr:DC1 - like 10 [Theobroma cacao]
MDSFVEDDFKEYYCDICEEERKPKHCGYCCKKCKFVAHIECALNKVVDMKLDQSSTSNLLDSEASTSKVQIGRFDHPHALSYNNAIEQNENLLCNACRQGIFYQHYACKDCKYYLHDMCTTLSYEVSHPLHRQHPLKLFTDIVEFTCHGCRDHSGGFAYMCLPCDFQLDVKCATTPIAPKNEGQRLKEMEKVSQLCPFNQNHKLDFFNHKPNLKDLALECNACKLPILGLDDSGGYYCDICEEERNAKYHCYCCEECAGQFVAHIECVLLTDFEFADENFHEFSNLKNANSFVERFSMDKLLSYSHAEVYLNQNRKKYWVDKKLNKYCFMLFARDFSILWAEDHRYWRWSYQREINSDVLIDVAELLDVCWLEMHVMFNVKKLSPKTLYGLVFVLMLTKEARGWEHPMNFGFILPNGYKVERKEPLKSKPRGVWIDIPIGEFTTSSAIVGEVDIYCHQYYTSNWKRGLIVKGVTILPKN